MTPCPLNLWLKLPEDCWGLIMPFVSDDDNTNLAEVFPKVAVQLKTFVFERFSIRPMAEQLKSFEACPKVNKIIVHQYPLKHIQNDTLINAVANINQKIESIDALRPSGHDGRDFRLSPSLSNELRMNYVKKLWQMKCPVDHFKDAIPFPRGLGTDYRSLRRRLNKRINYNGVCDYHKLCVDVFKNVTEIRSDKWNEGLNRLIHRCPKLHAIFLRVSSKDAWQPIPKKTSLLKAICYSSPSHIKKFLMVIERNKENLEEVFHGDFSDMTFHIKNNLLVVSTRCLEPLSTFITMFPEISCIIVEVCHRFKGRLLVDVVNEIEILNHGRDHPIRFKTRKCDHDQALIYN